MCGFVRLSHSSVRQYVCVGSVGGCWCSIVACQETIQVLKLRLHLHWYCERHCDSHGAQTFVKCSSEVIYIGTSCMSLSTWGRCRGPFGTLCTRPSTCAGASGMTTPIDGAHDVHHGKFSHVGEADAFPICLGSSRVGRLYFGSMLNFGRRCLLDCQLFTASSNQALCH